MAPPSAFAHVARRVDLDRVLRTSRYELLVEAQLRALRQRMEQLHEEIERRRESLVEADRAVRALEKLRDRRRAEFDRAALKSQQLELDELGLLGRRLRT